MITKDIRAFSNIRGSSILELMVYLSLLTITLGVGAKINQELLSKHRFDNLINEMQSLIKESIIQSRVTKTRSQIILVSQVNSPLLLKFLLHGKPQFIIELPPSIVQSAEITSGSVFKNQIEILPNGYVTPASIKISFKKKIKSHFKKLQINLSRLGNINLTWVK